MKIEFPPYCLKSCLNSLFLGLYKPPNSLHFLSLTCSHNYNLFLRSSRSRSGNTPIPARGRERKKKKRSVFCIFMEIVCVFCYILLFLSTLLSYPFLFLKKQKKKVPKQQRVYKLPPGSMGWPFIGETLQLYSQDPTVFFDSKQKRFLSFFLSFFFPPFLIFFFA